MLDYSNDFAEKLNQRIDDALEQENAQQVARTYLGGSRLGVNCSRALQYEYVGAPKDEGRNFSGKLLRIFAAGHVFEGLAISWLRMAGFDLYTEKANGHQFGFSVANGRIKGHVDGIINSAPAELGLSFPMLWECKSLNNKSWKDTQKKGLQVSKPVYAAQVATYQAYMEGAIEGISRNPALFTAINKDTAELYHELVPFNGKLAQDMSDKAVRILTASDVGEDMPRITRERTHFECKMCDWQDRCWGNAGGAN